jgi:demethylmenaquinone methyltransferase / 2-methoxy-6-polyprenyl-1,4-benzoquinol methylase
MSAASPKQSEGPAAGARPTGVSEERQAAAQVREMFREIAPRYDFLNHFLSFQMDRVWRRRVARRFANVLAKPESRALDICCGTGDLTIALLLKSKGTVFGSDFTHPMVVRAAQKTPANGHAGGMLGGYIEADALSLPFLDGTFDLVTVAFGFRNLANYDAGLREIFRVLRRDGQAGILEFSVPRGKVFPAFHRFYFKQIVPRIGGRISGSHRAYTYLPNSVDRFPSAEGLAARMSAAGFAKPEFNLWFGGSVALHSGIKP